MPARFHELAAYNGDRERGVQFDAATVERMRLLQTEFDAWREDRRRG